MSIMDKSLRDLEWLYETLSKGGKTSEFYEAQAPIIGEVLKRMETDMTMPHSAPERH